MIKKHISSKGGGTEGHCCRVIAHVSLFAAISEHLRGTSLEHLWNPDNGCQLLFDCAKPVRIPRGGCTAHPYFHDTMYFPPLSSLIAVGVNGWNWVDRKSVFVVFDFDSIVNHSMGLSPEQLAAILVRLQNVPWVSIVRSKSGQGFHVYVFFEPFPHAATHKEHAYNARRVLSHLSNELILDLAQSVDMCGAIAWIWHRDAAPNGFEIVKEAAL